MIDGDLSSFFNILPSNLRSLISSICLGVNPSSLSDTNSI